MNFVQKLLEAGFVEQGQKILLGIRPDKKNWIPDWWENYPYDKHRFGVSIDHPDAYFTKGDKKVIISLQGLLMPSPSEPEDVLLMNNQACRYISLKVKDRLIYQTFSGKPPGQNVLDYFLTCG